MEPGGGGLWTDSIAHIAHIGDQDKSVVTWTENYFDEKWKYWKTPRWFSTKLICYPIQVARSTNWFSSATSRWVSPDRRLVGGGYNWWLKSAIDPPINIEFRPLWPGSPLIDMSQTIWIGVSAFGKYRKLSVTRKLHWHKMYRVRRNFLVTPLLFSVDF